MIALILLFLSCLSKYYFSQAWIYLLACGIGCFLLPMLSYINVQHNLMSSLVNNLIGSSTQLPAKSNILHLRLELLKVQAQNGLANFRLILKWTLFSFSAFYSKLDEIMVQAVSGFHRLMQFSSIANSILEIQRIVTIDQVCIYYQRFLYSAVTQYRKSLRKIIKEIKVKENAIFLNLQLQNFKIHFISYSKALHSNQRKLLQSYYNLRMDLLIQIWPLVIIPNLNSLRATYFIQEKKEPLSWQYNKVTKEYRHLSKILKNISRALESKNDNPSLDPLFTKAHQNLIARLGEVHEKQLLLMQMYFK